MILFPLKRRGKRVVMELDATAVQAVSHNDLLPRGEFNLDFKFRSGHICNLAYIGAKNFEF